MSRPLTAISVEQAKPASARLEISDGGLPGLRLVVQPSGSKSWVVRYKTPTRLSRKITLGSYPLISLANARARARELLVAVADGGDPAANKSSRAAKATAAADDAARHRFAAMAEMFVERYAKPRNRTWKRTEQILLRSEVAEWADKDVREIARRDVIKVLDDIVARGAPVQANRTLAALKKFFRWARQRDRGQPCARSRHAVRGEPAGAGAFGRGTRSSLEGRSRHGVSIRLRLPLAHVDGAEAGRGVQRVAKRIAPEWRASALDHPEGALKERLGTSCATGSRRGGSFEWTAAFRRNRSAFHDHRQYTGERLRPSVRRLCRLAQTFMPTNVKLEPFVLHDLRRTFASGCARLGVPIHVTEANLNHTTGKLGGIAGVYQRFDFMTERRVAMNSWAEHVAALIEPKSAQTVSNLRSAI